MDPSGSLPLRRTPTTCGNQHRDGLAEHGGLGLDSAHAPAEHAQAVDHGGVRVGSDQRVRIGSLLAALARAGENYARQELQVDLVADAGVGRNDRQVLERLLSPAQEGVALAVALELQPAFDFGSAAECRTHRPAPSGR